MMKSLLFVLLAVAVSAYPEGAPEEACERDQEPDHEGEASPDGDDFYSLTAVDNGDGTFDVTLSTNSGDADIMGFFIQARSEGSGDEALGAWTIDSAIGQGRPCPADNADDNGVTHVDATNLQSEVTATFTGGADGLYFRASVVASFDVYYVNIRSAVVM